MRTFHALFCTCGRRKSYEDCCRPLHYLPLTQFRPSSGRNELFSLPSFTERDALKDLTSRLFTWPGYIVYLNSIRTAGKVNQIVNDSLYQARFILKRPGFSRYSDRAINFHENDGDSHFRVRNVEGRFGKSKEVVLKINEDSNSLKGCLDARGFITSVVYGPFAANSFEHAEYLASMRILKALSLLSLRFDSPLNVRTLQLEHLASGQMRQLQVVPDWEVSIPELIKINTSELMMLCSSFYREGLNSSSVLYAFLCYYKVITVVRHARRTHFKEARFPKERLPASEAEALSWIKEIFFVKEIHLHEHFLLNLIPEGVRWGMSFGEIIDSVLRPKRHEIAHALEDDPETLDPDDPNAIHEVRLMLPLIKLIARFMARNTYPDLLSPARSADFSSF